MNYPQEPVFIIGSPRSGTTVLGRIMMLLDDLYFQPSTESHFLYWLLEKMQPILENPGKFPAATNSQALASPKNHDALRGALADSIHHIYRTVGGETGDRNWVDKTPDVRQAEIIRQENLLTRPDETISKLLAFLAVDDQDNRHKRIRQFLLNNEVNRTPAFQGQSFNLQARASAADTALVQQTCGKEMAFWNYKI